MTRAWTAARTLGVLLVALLLTLGPGVSHAVAGTATAATTVAEVDHDQCKSHDHTRCGSDRSIPRSAPGTPAPRATGGYPGTAFAATVGRPVRAAAAGHHDHNRRLAALQTFRR
jgi:hypothetical protein